MSPLELIEQPFGTYAELIRAQARSRPGHPALIEDQRSVSFATLDAMMDRVAATLQREGIHGIPLPEDPLEHLAGGLEPESPVPALAGHQDGLLSGDQELTFIEPWPPYMYATTVGLPPSRGIFLM